MAIPSKLQMTGMTTPKLGQNPPISINFGHPKTSLQISSNISTNRVARHPFFGGPSPSLPESYGEADARLPAARRGLDEAQDEIAGLREGRTAGARGTLDESVVESSFNLRMYLLGGLEMGQSQKFRVARVVSKRSHGRIAWMI